MTAPLDDERFHQAMEQIARTAEGQIFYLFLQRRLMAVPADLKGGALRADAGERRFAAKLIGLMGKGIQESGGRTGSSIDGGREQPIVFSVAGPRRIADPGSGAGRRVNADTRVAGWDRAED
jgi:hypothetical protein